MSLRPFNNQTLQSYPKIQIDRGSVIKPCVADQTASDQFIDKPSPGWKKLIHGVWHQGVPFILRYISALDIPPNANTYYIYLIRAIKYVALLMLHIHSVYLFIYGYFYPYSLMTLDEVCDEFSRCPKWTESVIRAFAWHPNHDRCALAICNDYIYVYEGTSRVRVLRHNHQRKIVDLVWQPTNKEVLVVATQTHIILWRIGENHSGASGVKGHTQLSNFTYLIPGQHLIQRERESLLSGTTKQDSAISQSDCNPQPNERSFKLLEHILSPPIVSIQFDQSGKKLYACSPNSPKIAIIDIESLFNSNLKDNEKSNKHLDYIRVFGHGVTKLVWSPEKNRLATSTTSQFFRVFEPFAWTFKKWLSQGSIVQDMVWSRPTGRVLLIANKNEPFLYALPFLDSPQARDVGGNKSLMRALDLSPTKSETGDLVGGLIHSLVWDKDGKRLAISFKDNPQSILLYKTVETPTMDFHQLGVIQSDNSSYPLLMEFHDNFKNGSLLTICWSDGNCQHIPMSFMPSELSRNGSAKNDSFNKSLDPSTNNLNGANSSPKTPRSLTNFCHVSGNNSLSSYPSTLAPINKVQHQTTLFSLSTRSPLQENNSTDSSYT